MYRRGTMYYDAPRLPPNFRRNMEGRHHYYTVDRPRDMHVDALNTFTREETVLRRLRNSELMVQTLEDNFDNMNEDRETRRQCRILHRNYHRVGQEIRLLRCQGAKLRLFRLLPQQLTHFRLFVAGCLCAF